MRRFFKSSIESKTTTAAAHLTREQSALIKGSVPILRQHGEHLAKLFYADMLEAHPELSNIFNSVNQKNGRQPSALTSVILTFAANIADTSEVIPRLERVCNKHCSLGVTPDQYDVVGTFLLQAFAKVLGEKWTPELHKAWAKAYAILSRMLISRESQLYKEFGAWKGWKSLRITDKIAETEDIYSFYLQTTDGSPLPRFTPGQYISVRVNVPHIGNFQSRQYSLSDSPGMDHYRVSIKRDRGVQVGGGLEAFQLKPGLVSNLLLDTYSVGDTLDASHPAGAFIFDANKGRSNMPIVLISAGWGVTPLMSMLNSIMDRQSHRAVSWIQCSASSAPFEEYVRSLAAQRRNLRTHFWKNRVADVDYRNGTARAEGMRRDLERLSHEDLRLGDKSTEYYICGPEAFVQDMSNSLTVRGVAQARIRYEWFSTGDSRFKLSPD
jgi:nitric oxide dioxygenase